MQYHFRFMLILTVVPRALYLLGKRQTLYRLKTECLRYGVMNLCLLIWVWWVDALLVAAWEEKLVHS